MQNEKGKKPPDIGERTFGFALKIIRVLRLLPMTPASQIVAKQLIRPGTSVGANVEEAQAGYSREEFSYKMNIALKEARETHYWLRLLQQSGSVKPRQLDSLLDEADQIKKIIGSIVSRTRGKSK